MAMQQRTRIAFRSVNRRGQPDYDPGLQRHHILPRQLQSLRCFAAMFRHIGHDAVRFDDFRTNGLLLPASEDGAVRLALPLHRGPHRTYNEMVIARVGQIEAVWSSEVRLRPGAAVRHAVMRLSLIQRALRRRLLNPSGKRLSLNSKDPNGQAIDFAELDAMADILWGETERP